MTTNPLLQALIRSREGEYFMEQGDYFNASRKNKEASKHLLKTKCQTADRKALEALDSLSDYYSYQSLYQQRVHEYKASLSMSSTTSSITTSSTNKFKLTIDSHYIDDNQQNQSTPLSATPTSASSFSDKSLQSQLYELFIDPWKLYWNNHLQNLTDSSEVQQTFFSTMRHTERNLNILMQIANVNTSPTTPSNNSTRIAKQFEDHDEETIKQQDELANRLKVLYSNLNSVQVTRLEKRIQELEILLEQERSKNGK